MDDLLIFMVT